MLTICNFKVFSLDVDFLDMTWEIESTTEDPWDYAITVQRSESPMGPWDSVSAEFTDRYWFRDVTLNQFHRTRTFFYRLKIRRKSDDGTSYSDVAHQGAKPDLVALEVRRLEYLALREHIGRRCWIFIRRTFGQRCPDCYDPVSGQQFRAQCGTCFDTTFVRGYLDPIETYIQFDPQPRHTEINQLIETQQENCSARTIDFPLMKPGDIIVEAENARWRVEKVSLTQRLRAPLHQELILHGIPPSDIEFKLPIRLDDLGSFEPSPEREFTNPHNLEAHKEADFLAASMAVYGYRGRS